MNGNNILSALEQMRTNFSQRYEKNFWKYNYPGEHINDVFNQLTKDDLLQISRHLNLKIPTQLKKQEVIEEINKLFFLGLEFFLTYLSDYQFSFVQYLLNHQGLVPYEEQFHLPLTYLKKLGIAFPVMKDGQKMILMPKETQELINHELSVGKLKERLKLNTEIIQASLGLIHYYGAVFVYKLHEMIQSYFPDHDLHFNLFYSFLSQYQSHDKTIGLLGSYYHLDGYNESEINSIIDNQLKYRHEYYPIKKLRALQASDRSYLEQTPHVLALSKFIRERYDIKEDQLKQFLYDLVESIKIGQPFNHHLQIISRYFQPLDLKDTQTLVDLIKELHNHTRMWVLKGYMPVELGESKTPPTLA